jgi:pterin-4a-carbinolamine dehydratase
MKLQSAVGLSRTHKIRGLHRNDFIMAAKTDVLAAESGHHC